MAVLKVKNLKQVQNQIRRRITKQLRTKSMRDGVGQIVADEIQDSDFGRPSDSYYDWRSDNDGLNATHKKYDRDKINITFTGALLKDLATNVKLNSTAGKAEYVIEHSDKLHKAYKTKSGKTKRVSFATISEGVSKYYAYLTFSSKSKKKVLKFIKDNLFKQLK
jgi:hypothetical protein